MPPDMFQYASHKIPVCSAIYICAFSLEGIEKSTFSVVNHETFAYLTKTFVPNVAWIVFMASGCSPYALDPTELRYFVSYR